MKTVKITIDNRSTAVPAGRSILDAAKELDIHIPTLCHLNGYERFTSCMICVVYEVNTDRLLPSCSAAVTEGMRVETENEKVREARKDALDFLLSEHVGDCEAPCQRACPAHMDIPLMIRQIKNGQLEDAIRTVKRDIALPAVLGRICPAPCENGCHRKPYDNSVSICLLKRHAADVDLALESPFRPVSKSASGKTVAVIGSGPAGLSAAYYLLQDGHACHVYDRHPLPGGMLRYGVPDEELPKNVLDSEIERISAQGAEFRMERSLGRNLEWDQLKNGYDSVVLAVGKIDPEVFENSGIALSPKGVVINRKTFETNVPGFFAGGNAVSESRMAVRAAAHGKNIAFSVNQFLNKNVVAGSPRRFNSLLGKISMEEAEEFLKESEEFERLTPRGGVFSGYSEDEAVRESLRCFGCDCRKPESCKLRRYAEEYRADQRRFTFVERKSFRRNIQHERLVYEPGKCIKCGLCVRITEKAGEKLGLAFIGRGFDVRVETPFGEPLSRGLMKAAGECVTACPTGALSWRDRN